jgi:aspartyl-tRNA(Asn)/glutamyl-tRNA(Gln) amidotransferase subunit C
MWPASHTWPVCMLPKPTANVEPMAHPLAGQVQRLRADTVTETDNHEKFQRNAPRTEAGLYLVPKVIE